jgi:hypothetical protein
MKTSALFLPCMALAGLLGAPSLAHADDIVYGNNAGSGNDMANKFDINIGAGTATLLQSYTLNDGNGRGMVVVGNVMYTTVVGDGHIYETDATTGLPIGSIDTGLPSLSTIAWDGTNFWASSYSGTNQAYEITTAGAVINTITLNSASGFFDGMEWFNGQLIANEGDAEGPYDIYTLTGGNPTTSAFLNAGSGSTGIAYDGTDFLTSNIFDSSISVWDGATGAFIETIALPTPPSGNLIEDLSVNYNTTTNKPPSVPDSGSTIAMLGMAVLVCGMARKRLLAA